MTRSIAMLACLLAGNGVASADGAVFALPRIGHTVTVNNFVLLENDTPGHAYFLCNAPGGGRQTRLSLVQNQRVKVNAWSTRLGRGTTTLYAVPHEVESRYQTTEELFTAHGNGAFQLTSVALEGDRHGRPFNAELELEVTVTIRRGPNGPAFDVTTKTVATQSTRQAWAVLIVGLVLTVAPISFGLCWAYRVKRRAVCSK